jgi:hypothetical protein
VSTLVHPRNFGGVRLIANKKNGSNQKHDRHQISMTGKIVSKHNHDRHQISMTEKIVRKHNHDRHQISMTGKTMSIMIVLTDYFLCH